MALDAHNLELKLIRRGQGIELDLLPLQGLWTEEQYSAVVVRVGQSLVERE
jgi:hypothetical protein